MHVALSLGRGPYVQRNRGKNRRLALAAAALLSPAMLAAWVLVLWRLTADLRWTAEFAITSGPFSHWQTWFGAAACLHVLANRLKAYGLGRFRARTARVVQTAEPVVQPAPIPELSHPALVPWPPLRRPVTERPTIYRAAAGRRF